MTDYEFVTAIDDELSKIQTLLITKNKSYGSSVFNPINIFSKLDAESAILVRIDDKISRLKSNQEYNHEDTEQDLIGYLILLRVLRKWKKEQKTTDN